VRHKKQEFVPYILQIVSFFVIYYHLIISTKRGKLRLIDMKTFKRGLFMKKQLIMSVFAGLCCTGALIASEQKAYKDMSKDEKRALAKQDSAKMRVKLPERDEYWLYRGRENEDENKRMQQKADKWFKAWRQKDNGENAQLIDAWKKEHADISAKNSDEHAKKELQWHTDKQSVEQWKEQEHELREELHGYSSSYFCPAGKFVHMKQDIEESREGLVSLLNFSSKYFKPFEAISWFEYNHTKKNMPSLVEKKVESEIEHEISLLQKHHDIVKQEEKRSMDCIALQYELNLLKRAEAKRAVFKSSMGVSTNDRKLYSLINEMLAKE
jgi:hypothetical protein